VDEQFAAALEHGGGRISAITAGTRTASPHEATVLGTEGYARIHSPWWRPEAMTISKPGHEDEVVREPTEENGFRYEAAEVMRCLGAGERESRIMPLDETVSCWRRWTRSGRPGACGTRARRQARRRVKL
jgi:hypothetical protein